MTIKKKINVLYIGIGPYTGGPVVSLVQLIENLDRKIYTPVVFSLSSPHTETLNKLNTLDGVQIIEKPLWINNWLQSSTFKTTKSFWQKVKAPGRLLRLFYNSWQISRIIMKHNIDLVHTNIELILEGAIAAWLTNKPHIWHIRAPLGKKGAVKHSFGQRFCCSVISLLSKRIIVNSFATKESIDKYIDNKKIDLIYNGINPKEFNSTDSRSSLRTLLNIPGNKKIIASIGCLSKIKGGEEFLTIALDVCQSSNDVVFIWIGASKENAGDEFCETIFSKIALYKLENRILFTGERKDIPSLLSEVNIFLQPMVNGSWSRVVLEAMAASIPVIAIEENLVSEFITNNENGILVKNENEAAEKIKDILLNEDNLKLVGVKGQNTVLSTFTNDITAKKVMAIYDEMITE